MELFDYKLLLAVPAIPIVGYVIQIFFGRHLPRKGDWMLTGGMFVVMCITVYMFLTKAIGFEPSPGNAALLHESAKEGGPIFGWLYSSAEKAPGFNLVAGIMYDGLGAAMLMVVGVVSFFVHLFSLGYMNGDRRYHIFFANISLFTFAMLGLVLSDNIMFLFIFWELMGLMSYLLIGHFAQDPDSPRITHAAAACKKAFLTTRVGDTCLLFGMALFYWKFQTFQFTELWRLSAEEVARNGGEYPMWMTVGGFFIFGGTVGKSAQFPLHIWLPDAMEGPTPVSAMIHAATMVAAGVFLLGRTFPMMSPEVLAIVTAVGAFTALFAATIGCTVNDIKGVLAYSTISQLGFMVAAIGTGGLGLVAGLFHMVTHAFFKACLFLSAGSVIHGCHHEQDMRKMGGLRTKMPITFVCMTVCTLAIAGMPLFSGFFSKDRILQGTLGNLFTQFRGASALSIVALSLAAMLTTFYMFRLIFMTFFGEPRDHHIHDHAHESPWPMTVSLMALAALGLFGGHFWLLHPTDPLAQGHHGTWFTQLVDWKTMYGGVFDPMAANMIVDRYNPYHLVDGQYVLDSAIVAAGTEHYEHAVHGAHYWALGISLLVLSLGLFGAWLLYYKRKVDPARITGALGFGYDVVRDKYYIDEAVDGSVIKGTMWLSRVQKWIDEKLVDGLVLLVGRIGKILGYICSWIDKYIVDGAVNWVGYTTQAFGSVARLFQTGRIQQYISFAVAGGILIAAVHILT
ncbi:MAG: NADH-quinone oxidoreductase subunit L [bacterium]|nr:NADH-quinone oxidoreductase subunit L [bacterium]